MPRKPVRRPSPTRFARAYTWQPATRLERTVRRRRLPFSGDVRDLIDGAAQMVAPLRPFRVWVVFFPPHQTLNLCCGADAHGVQTHITVTLHRSDVGLLAYFVRDRSVKGTLFVDLPADDDGEDLAIPRVSVDDLARIPAPVAG